MNMFIKFVVFFSLFLLFNHSISALAEHNTFRTVGPHQLDHISNLGKTYPISFESDADKRHQKFTHIIGTDSRTRDFSYGDNSGYYYTNIQAEKARDSLAHVQCEQRGKMNTNTTSGFFVDVEHFARKKNIEGDVSQCKNKVLVSVAHYVSRWGGESKSKCRIRRTFETEDLKLGKNGQNLTSDLGIVRKMLIGHNFPSKYNSDYVFFKVDNMRNLRNKNFSTLKICSAQTALNSLSGNICTGFYKGEVILPHIAKSTYILDDRANRAKYRAKLTTDRCCISEKEDGLDLLSHTCDMKKKSSGAPLLNISNPEDVCVLGIQKGQSVPDADIQKNYAVSVMDYNFQEDFKKFIKKNCIVKTQ